MDLGTYSFEEGVRSSSCFGNQHFVVGTLVHQSGILLKIAMSSSTFNVWFCCGDCGDNLFSFNGLVKELVSHRNSESRWLLFGENAGLNVKFDGRKAINQAPASVTSIQVKDEGRMTQTDLADIHCSKCDGHIGWKIDSWEKQIFAPPEETDGRRHG
ncbi:uncharacterized protein LOC104882580 isoform X2 [Vitis vinifera]|uniref:uncharacterized protein LOC104882580 isoform X2 n=1 Tax=Vitis vinifera TaxID=29760 RepID=UPI0008FF8FD1|nr:uncharacterized protein LOC104882580 isoform X2 [Vitis vinifera]|eukprot:XP_019081622.1 PREDICTED: uncharacterized protein LOC104882580 isoform X2 [Vitis vinifera]